MKTGLTVKYTWEKGLTVGLLVLATAAFPFRIRSLLKLLTSLALLLEELQHIQHRGAPQSETQLTIAKALRSCVRRANKDYGEPDRHSLTKSML